jgi:nitrate/TMAO reductase-like tetraheme cytochrome c subunit
MRGVIIFFLVTVASVGWAEDDEWQYQSYKESKRLPDLHHAVDIEISDAMNPPESFELKEGRFLQCKTCHGLKQMDQIKYDQIDKTDPSFLRGGPYRELTDFCFQCHDREDHERPNIHVMLNDEGEVQKDHCLYCHETLHKERDIPKRVEQIKLRIPADKLCLGCHLKTPHLNAIEHLEAEPEEEMKKHMERETEKNGIILPLSQDGKVTCISCHSPHPEGVIDAAKNPAGNQVSGDVKEGIKYKKHRWSEIVRQDKADRLEMHAFRTGAFYELPYGRIDKEVLLRRSAKNGDLCLSCHQFER